MVCCLGLIAPWLIDAVTKLQNHIELLRSEHKRLLVSLGLFSQISGSRTYSQWSSASQLIFEFVAIPPSPLSPLFPVLKRVSVRAEMLNWSVSCPQQPGQAAH